MHYNSSSPRSKNTKFQWHKAGGGARGSGWLVQINQKKAKKNQRQNPPRGLDGGDIAFITPNTGSPDGQQISEAGPHLPELRLGVPDKGDLWLVCDSELCPLSVHVQRETVEKQSHGTRSYPPKEIRRERPSISKAVHISSDQGPSVPPSRTSVGKAVSSVTP